MEPNTAGDNSDNASPVVESKATSFADSTPALEKLDKKFRNQLSKMCGDRNYLRFRHDELNAKILAAQEQYAAALSVRGYDSERQAEALLRDAILRLKGLSVSQIKTK